MENNKFKNYFITPQLKLALALTFRRILCIMSVYAIFFLMFLSLKLLQECAQFMMIYEMFHLFSVQLMIPVTELVCRWKYELIAWGTDLSSVSISLIFLCIFVFSVRWHFFVDINNIIQLQISGALQQQRNCMIGMGYWYLSGVSELKPVILFPTLMRFE